MSSPLLDGRPHVASRRPIRLALFARFTDELLFGSADVLLPTIRASLGLSYAQVGALSLALAYVAYVVDPLLSLLIDVWRRKWLLAGGAAMVGLAVVFVGLAPTFGLLLLGYALYGIGAGPLAYTADAVLVESSPEAPRRIFARATALDTLGALLGPSARRRLAVGRPRVAVVAGEPRGRLADLRRPPRKDNLPPEHTAA